MKMRLINCDFVTEGALSELDNKAKLLYLYMFLKADDLGFVGSINQIISLLTQSSDNNSLELLNNDYYSALETLGNKGFIYRFTDNHNHSVYLIRHWFIHNKWKKGLGSNYSKYRGMVELLNYEYVLKESSKEIVKLNIKQSNINQDNTNQINNDSWDMLVNDIERLPKNETDNNEGT